MKGISKKLWLVIILFSIGAIFIGSKQVKPGKEKWDGIQAGVSKILVTPEKPVRMSGYAARKDPFKGVHDDLFDSRAKQHRDHTTDNLGVFVSQLN